MIGSRGLMRGRGGSQVVEDKQESSRCGAFTSNDLRCWRSGKSYGRIDNRRLRQNIWLCSLSCSEAQ